MNLFTIEEKQILMELLQSVQLSPLAPNAAKSVELIQSVAKKIEALTEKAETAKG
jgi:hypothetical protein